jgi:hypothetical protein
MVVHAYKLSTWEAEGGGLWVQSQFLGRSVATGRSSLKKPKNILKYMFNLNIVYNKYKFKHNT